MICLSPNGETSFDLADRTLRTILVGTAKGVARLERAGNGDAWRVAGVALPAEQVGAIVCGSGGRVFAGTRRGVFRSRDGGLSWEPVVRGLTNPKVFSLAIARTPAGDVLYAGTDPVSLFTSVDDGDHWRELSAIAHMPGSEKWTFPAPPHLPHTKALTIDRSQPTTLYAAIEQGALLKSVDAGASWTEMHGYERDDDKVERDIHRFAWAPWNAALFFLATGTGLSRSTDGGRSWEQSASLKQAIAYPDVMEVSLRADKTVFVGGAHYNPRDWFSTGAAGGTVYRSRDEGRTWEAANQGLALDPRANVEAMTLAAHWGGVSVFIGTTDGEVFATEDLGESWSRIATGLAPITKHGHASLLKVVSSVPRRLRPPFAAFAATMNATTQRIALALRTRRMRSMDTRHNDHP